MKHLKLLEDLYAGWENNASSGQLSSSPVNDPGYWLDYQSPDSTQGDPAHGKKLTSLPEILNEIGDAFDDWQNNSEEGKEGPMNFMFSDIFNEISNFYNEHKWINRSIIDAMISQM